MRGRALMFEFLRRPTRENNNAARVLFEQALAINPEDAGALAGDADTYLADKVNGWTSADVDYDDKIVGQADRSIAIAPNDPEPYSTKSLYLSYVLHRYGRGLRAADAGLAFESRLRAPVPCTWHRRKPNRDVRRRQNPTYCMPFNLALAIRTWVFGKHIDRIRLGLGHFDDAIIDSHRAIDAGYRTFLVYSNLAVACAMSNRTGRREGSGRRGPQV